MQGLLNEVRKLREVEGLVQGDAAASTSTGVGGKKVSKGISEMLSSISLDSKDSKDSKASSKGGKDSNEIGKDSKDKAIGDGPDLKEIEEMIGILAYLDNLRGKDPKGYVKALRSMGMVGDDFDLDKPNVVDPVKAMMESVSKLRETIGSSTESAGINLPDGGQLGADKKVKGKFITPEPGFVVKSKQVADGKKVFINLCVHADLDAPAMKKRLNDEGEEVEGMNVPMSVGPVRIEKDNKQVDCLVYDVIVNPQVVADAAEDKTGKYRDFVCQLLLQCVEQKYKMELDRQYKLPKLTYMKAEGAEIQKQYIQDRANMPKIEEVQRKGGASKPAPKKVVEVEVPDLDLAHELQWVGSEVDIDGSIKGESFKLAQNEYLEPMVMPASSFSSIVFEAVLDTIELNKAFVKFTMSPYRFQLKIPGFKQISYYLPCAVDPVNTKCKVSSVPYPRIVISFPIDKNPWHLYSDAGSKPWLINDAMRVNKTNDDISCYLKDDNMASETKQTGIAGTNKTTFAEDKFHINLPDNVDHYTGQKMNIENEELPEDKYHKADAASSYILQQREQSIKDKHEKAAKEREERISDPNVEYIDASSFPRQPIAGINPDSASSTIEGAEYLRQASDVILSRVGGTSTSGDASQATSTKMSSNLWAELLE